MHNFSKPFGFVAMSLLVSACGGGGGGSDPIEPFPLATAGGTATVIELDATALTTDETTGTWASGAQEITVGGETLSALATPVVADGLAFVREVTGGSGGETLVYTPTLIENLPTGTATYNGAASVVITDAAGNSVSYTLTGTSTAVASLTNRDLDVTLSDLSGERTASAAGPQAFATDGTIVIEDLTLSSRGGIGTDGNTSATINGIESVALAASASVSAAGGIAGTSGQEIAGVAAISDDDTIMLTTFAGQQ